MNIIVAMDRNRGIGYKGKLLADLKEDKKFFKEKTMNKTVIMGRRTFEGLPGGKPLQGRDNIILTTQLDYHVDGATVLHSKNEVLKFIEKRNIPSDNIFVIGGGIVYDQFIDDCDTVYITSIYEEFRYVDTYFPVLGTNWKLINEETLTDKASVDTWKNLCIRNNIEEEFNRIQANYSDLLNILQTKRVFTLNLWKDNHSPNATQKRIYIEDGYDGVFEYKLNKKICEELSRMFKDLSEIADI